MSDSERRAPIWSLRIRWIMRGGADHKLIARPGATTQTQRDLLLALADIAMDDGSVHPDAAPTVRSLAKQIHVSEAVARRGLHALRENGLIRMTIDGERSGAAPLFAIVVDAIRPAGRTCHRWGGHPASSRRPATPPGSDRGPLPESTGVSDPEPLPESTPLPDLTGDPFQNRQGTPPGSGTPLPYRIVGSEVSDPAGAATPPRLPVESTPGNEDEPEPQTARSAQIPLLAISPGNPAKRSKGSRAQKTPTPQKPKSDAAPVREVYIAEWREHLGGGTTDPPIAAAENTAIRKLVDTLGVDASKKLVSDAMRLETVRKRFGSIRKIASDPAAVMAAIAEAERVGPWPRQGWSPQEPQRPRTFTPKAPIVTPLQALVRHQ